MNTFISTQTLLSYQNPPNRWEQFHPTSAPCELCSCTHARTSACHHVRENVPASTSNCLRMSENGWWCGTFLCKHTDVRSVTHELYTWTCDMARRVAAPRPASMPASRRPPFQASSSSIVRAGISRLGAHGARNRSVPVSRGATLSCWRRGAVHIDVT